MILSAILNIFMSRVKLFKRDDCNAVFPFAVYPDTEGVHELMSAQFVLNGGTERSGALSVNDPDLGLR